MAGIRVAHDYGRDELALLTYVPHFRKVVIPLADLDASLDYLIPVQKGAIVLGVGVIVDEAFDGTPTVQVGTAGTANAFVATTDITLTSVNDFFYGAPTEGGVYFPAAANVIVDVSATTPTTGQLTVLVHELEFADNWRQIGLGV